MIAGRMNSASKVLVSRTLDAPEPLWSNTTLVRDARDLRSDKKLLVLGSAVLTTSLLEEGLLGELRIMVAPVLIGARPLSGEHGQAPHRAGAAKPPGVRQRQRPPGLSAGTHEHERVKSSRTALCQTRTPPR